MIHGLLGLAAIVGSIGGPLCAETTTTETINIATSNVATDLTALYGVNFQNAVPQKAHGDLYDDFKYLTALSRGGEMYFYVYCQSATALSGAKLTYSDSKVLADAGGYTENSHTATLTLLNHWGRIGEFYKFKCDQLYSYNPTSTDGSQTHRFKAITFDGLSSTGTSITGARSCEVTKGGYIWNDEAENSDQVYDYYKDNYIVINDDAFCWSQLIESDKVGSYWYNVGAGSSATSAMKENHWLFFNVKDYHVSGYEQFDLKYLIGAQLRYQPCSYDMTYLMNERADLVHGTLPRIFTGHYLDGHGNKATGELDTFISMVKSQVDSAADPRDAKYENVTYGKPVLKTLTKSDLEDETKLTDSGSYPVSNIPGVSQGNWNLTYKWNRVYKMDTTSVSAISDDDDHIAIKSFLKQWEGQYEWAINFDQTTRTMTDAQQFNSISDWWWDLSKITTKCNDILDAQFTVLTFSNGYATADLNAIMDPVSTSGTTTSPTARVTYTSAIVDSVKDLLSFLWNTFSTAAKVLSIAACVAAGLILIYGVYWVLSKMGAFHRSGGSDSKE